MGSEGRGADPSPGGWAGFRSEATVRTRDGRILHFETRLHRKHQAAAFVGGGATWWAPEARGWWIGICFAVGSALFGLGTVPAYVSAVGPGADGATFFVGSIFFTSAGYLTYREAVDAGAPPGPHPKVLLLLPGRIDWWASGIQLLGTLFFNVSTGYALSVAVGSASYRHAVWRPDAFGSVCFLVASWLAWAEVCHGAWALRPRSYGWWIAALNLVGSVAFAVSAVAAFATTGGAELNAQLANGGTFVGAACFLVGAILLLPERTDQRGAEEARQAAPLLSGGGELSRPAGSRPRAET